MNQDGAFVQYTPGTMAGLNHLANSPLCGPELQFVQRWKSRFPTKDLYICKCAAGGATQARGNAYGTDTTSANAGVLTSTGPVGANTVLIGTGIPTGTYVLDTSAHTLGTIGTVGQNTSITFASTTTSLLDGMNSGSPTEGCLYSGHFGLISNGVRGLINTAISGLNNPRIRAMIYSFGINDCATSLSDATNLFPRDMAAFFSQFDIDFPVANSVIKRFLLRPKLDGASSQQDVIRAAVANEAATRSNTYMIDTDSYVRWDNVHYDKAGITIASNFAFDHTFP